MAQGVRGTGGAKERNLRYIQNHPEKRLQTCRNYRATNLNKARESARIWARKNYMLNGRVKTNEWESCNKEQVRKIRRKSHLRNCYNLSEKDFLALLHKQQNRCAICETEFEKTPAVDHDHATGLVRGLLCLICNSSLGGFKDDPRILTNAISYLCK